MASTAGVGVHSEESGDAAAARKARVERALMMMQLDLSGGS